jgi:hypothetical protein
MAFWLAVLTAATVAKIVLQLRIDSRDKRIEHTLARVDRMLVVWATHWDESPDRMKTHLQQAMLG